MGCDGSNIQLIYITRIPTNRKKKNVPNTRMCPTLSYRKEELL